MIPADLEIRDPAIVYFNAFFQFDLFTKTFDVYNAFEFLPYTNVRTVQVPCGATIPIRSSSN